MARSPSHSIQVQQQQLGWEHSSFLYAFGHCMPQQQVSWTESLEEESQLGRFHFSILITRVGSSRRWEVDMKIIKL